MIFGRLVGWALVGLAMLMASGDAVMALGPGDHVGILTGDIWMLLAGKSAFLEPVAPSFTGVLLAWPVWTLIAPLGLGILWASRPRPRRFRFRP